MYVCVYVHTYEAIAVTCQSILEVIYIYIYIGKHISTYLHTNILIHTYKHTPSLQGPVRSRDVEFSNQPLSPSRNRTNPDPNRPMSPLPQNSCFPDASQSPSRAPSPEDSFVTSKDKDTSMQRDVTSNGPTDTSMQRDVTSNGPAPVLQVGTYICIDVCVYIHVCEVRMDLCMY